MAGIPQPRANLESNLLNVLNKLKSFAEVGDGITGDPQERFLRIKDLIDAGILERIGKINNARLVAGTNLVSAMPVPSRSRPPAPTNLVVTGGFSYVFLEWDNPLLAYRNHSYTEVFRSTDENIGNAVKIGQTGLGYLFADQNVEQDVNYYYWIRFVSESGITGPYNSEVGTKGARSLDPEDLINIISGEINESVLAEQLRAEINLISEPGGIVDQINSLISATDQNGQDIQASSSAITQLNTSLSNLDNLLSSVSESVTQLSTTVGENTATLEIQGQSVDGLNAQWTVKTQVGNLVGGVGFLNNGQSTQFLVSASTFAVLGENNSVVVPFIVVDGVTYIDTARIRNGTISSAQIGSLSVDKLTGFDASFILANIGVGNITNAYIGNTIQSNSFSSTTGWRLSKNGSIEASSIIIRNSLGQIILNSGGVDWNQVVGSGRPENNANRITDTSQISDGANLGGTANWSGVSGAGRPADNADVTANSRQGASWLTNSVVGDHNRISSSNIGTYILAAAITNAYIGNAAVDTLQLAGQSVFITRLVLSTSTLSISNVQSDGWYHALSGSVTMTNTVSTSAISINMHAYAVLNMSAQVSGAEGFFNMRLLRGGQVLRTWTLLATSGMNQDSFSDGSFTEVSRGSVSVPFLDQPGSGTHTYTIEFQIQKNQSANSVNATIFQRTLVIEGAKR